MTERIKIFLSYSHTDKDLVQELKKYLEMLRVEALVDIWDDTQIKAGEEWMQVIDNHFSTAELILLLVSPSFMTSEFCQMQLQEAMRRHAAGMAKVIPILLRPLEWRNAPFAKLQVLPSSARPVTEWSNREDAWIDVVEGIRPVVEDLKLSSLSEPVVQPSPLRRQIVGQLVDEGGLIGAVSDRPKTDSKDDKLGFKRYVNILYGFITAPETTTPLVISISGSWGMGKSSLMGMLKQQLEPKEGYYLSMYWQGLAWHVGQIGRKKPTNDQKGDQVFIKQRIGGLRLSRWLLQRAGVKDPEKTERILEQIAKRETMELLYYPTVWFNAWKFTEEGQIWAALASEIINQLNSKQYALLTRLQFWFQLKRKRANLAPAIGRILLNLLVIIVLALVSILYPSYIHPFITDHILPFFKNLFPTQSAASGAASTTATVGGFALFLATALQVIRAAYKIAKTHPFQIPINTIIENPNYQERIGYISQFSEDFRRIVSVTTRRSSPAWETQKLVIFIDDLDRCRPLQAAGIIEAISLFLDSEQCVFVMGIDTDTVVASIEAKYKELVEKIHHDKPEIVSFGKAFLEKIIQISLSVPYANEAHIRELITSLSESNGKASTLPAVAGTTFADNQRIETDRVVEAVLQVQQAVRAYFGKENVQNAILVASQLLKHNPRRTKQFINLFRLKLFFLNREASMRRYLEEGDEGLEDFAIILAWSMQWTEVAKLVVYSQHSAEICNYLLTLCEKLQESGEQPSNQQAQARASAGQASSRSGQVDTIRYDLSVFDEIIQDLIVQRGKMEKFPAHWYYLPWEEWIYDDAFRFCIVRFRDQWQAEKEGKPSSLLAFVRL